MVRAQQCFYFSCRDVKPEAVYQLAKTYFDKIPTRKLPQLKPQRTPKGLGLRQVNINIPAKVPMLFLGFNTPSIITAKNKQAAYALTVAAALLSYDDSSRLSQTLVRKEKLASSAGASYELYNLYSGLFELNATPRKKCQFRQIKTSITRRN